MIPASLHMKEFLAVVAVGSESGLAALARSSVVAILTMVGEADPRIRPHNSCYIGTALAQRGIALRLRMGLPLF